MAQPKTIHVYVALCDNENQGIVKVPETLGNGQDAYNNLYWGATYGLKSYFKNKTNDWKMVAKLKSNNTNILERILFKHATEEIFMLAEAYDGAKMKACIEDFLRAANGQQPVKVSYNNGSIHFGGSANLLAFVGHNGLMDFQVQVKYIAPKKEDKEVIILACYSQNYFSPEIVKSDAQPLLWTTHLMAPEAYTLKAAIDGWIKNESGDKIKERAAQAYHKYQKCGIRGARNLFVTGF